MRRALLISPAPVDGYPPVQAQARLLARDGYSVTLVTTARRHTGQVRFNEPGVTVVTLCELKTRFGQLARIQRLISFVRAITNARRNGKLDVEIAYDPLAMLYSDLAPQKPPQRIAHFHESLLLKRWIERRLRTAIRSFSRVVVPDEGRGQALLQQLDLRTAPLVVPNYPLLRAPPRRSTTRSGLEVVYCGVLGRGQNLPLILACVPLWPADTRLTLIGDCETGLGRALQAQVRDAGLSGRIRFTGWVDLAELPERLAQADLGLCLLDDAPEQFRTALGASNKRYQYMQAGLAQIGDRNPGVADLLEGQRIGRCLESYSAEALARLVHHYARDPDALRSEGERAATLHRTEYNYEAAFAPLLVCIRNDDLRDAA